MSQRLVFIFLYTSLITLVTHFITYININQIIIRLDSVYASNSKLLELKQSINKVQQNMYEYLNLKSSDALENYYINLQELQNKLGQFNNKITDCTALMMERHIRIISERYIEKTSEAVQAKRGRNIRKYNESYNEASLLIHYLEDYIDSLNNNQFKENSTNYLQLKHSLSYFKWVSTLILIIIIGMNMMILLIISRQLTRPLINLSKTADRIAAGDFKVVIPEIHTGDEVERLANAFSKMITNIREYIEKIKEQMIVESKLKENELKMENYLKDAELKYLQAQINPHFLFNTLNAAMQLAMMEEAEQTSIFIDNMAEFFRYSITKGKQDTTLEDEITLVDHYIYILNVRFCGEIEYEKEVDRTLLSLKVPSMIIQPIVENIFQHGIHDMEGKGKINLKVYKRENKVCIEVEDNGCGMTQERIKQVLEGDDNKDKREGKVSNGIGLGNVKSRLSLYYGIEDVITIMSGGINKGTKVILKIPQ